MRKSRAVAAGLTVLAVLAVSGTGFAAFTTAAFEHPNAAAGTLGPLVWGEGPTATAFGYGDVCNATVGTTNTAGDTIFLLATGLLPGDFCTFGDTLANLGSLPAASSAQVTSASGTLCTVLTYADTFFNPSITVGTGGQVGAHTPTIHAHGQINWAGTISLPASTGNAYQGTSCAFMVTITGTAGH